MSDSFLNAYNLLKNFIENDNNIKSVKELSSVISNCFKNSNKVIIAGNGGSACDAMHFAEEFTGKFRKTRPPLPAISLTDSSHITCVANDFGFEDVFSRGVQAYGKEGDVFIGLSTSGNSPNIIKAIKTAKEMNLKTIALLGKDGGKLKNKSDYQIIIEEKTSDRIQELHMMILHIIIENVEKDLFPQLY